MKVKVSEATGTVLDWMVWSITFKDATKNVEELAAALDPNYSPTTDWAQGGPIIERAGIAVTRTPAEWCAYAPCGMIDIGHYGVVFKWGHKQAGPTPLIAAMRCYCASVLGDDVEVPGELLP